MGPSQLLYLAGGLRRRKRTAWTVTVGLTALVAVSRLAKGLDLEEALTALVLLGLLPACRGEFYAEADPGGRRLALRRAVQLTAIGTGLGLALLRALLDRHGRRDLLGSFALRRAKSAVWSPSGNAAMPYRVLHGVLLASGDPIGGPEA